MSFTRRWLGAFGLLGLIGCGAGAPVVVQDAPPGAEEDADNLAAWEQSVDDLDSELQVSLEVEPAEPPVDCASVCGLRFEICDLSQRICDISARHPGWDRPALQCTDAAARCDGAEEDTDRVCDCAPFQPDVPI